MRKLMLTVAAIAGLFPAEAATLNITSDCAGNNCSDEQAVIEVEVPKGGLEPLILKVGGQAEVDFGKVLEGKWARQITLSGDDGGRNLVTVTDKKGNTGTIVLSFREDDSRPDFEATAYAGVGIDSFAAGDLNKLINSDQTGDVKERGVAGIDFAYRLFSKGPRQVWLYGESVHGVRSAGIDCKAEESDKEPGKGVCVEFDPVKLPNRTLRIIRASTSLEAFAGLRVELFRIAAKTQAPASLYLKGQLGFVTVAGHGRDLFDSHLFAGGAICTAGRFAGSYFEAGVGRTDLYPGYESGRLKIDGYVQFPLFGKWVANHGLTGFAQMTIDSSLKKGSSDSVQSFFGINFDLPTLFGGE